MLPVAVLALFLGGSAVASSGAGAIGASIDPPVIRETFTVLPCPGHPVTTRDLEGCAEKASLQSDRTINARAKRILGLLRSNGARTAFVRGEQSWLSYRRTSCSAEASKVAGGSLEPVAFARCDVARNNAHLADLAQMERTLRQG